MKGWLILLKMSLSVYVYLTIFSIIIFFLSSVFIAYLFFVTFDSTKNTYPNDPYPSTAIGMKSLTEYFFGFMISSNISLNYYFAYYAFMLSSSSPFDSKFFIFSLIFFVCSNLFNSSC
jgi:hypothetical protein